MKFKIEKVKWSWAKTVKSPDVYRDDEFIRTNTKEEALEAIDFLMKTPKGLTYLITVFKEDQYFTYWRHSMPCLGGLVKYRDSHGDRYFMNPYFPRDIRVPFPDGDIIFITCHRPGSKDILKSAYFEFVFSDESPWVDAFGKKETIIFKDSYFVLTNMKTDPTVFYSLMRQGGLVYNYASPYANWNVKAILLAARYNDSDPRRLAGQKPLRISGGTWEEGYGYTRPYNESIFKTSLPTQFKDFGKLAGYPQAAFTSTFFADMKKEFKVDLTKGFGDKEKVLVEAWDYFKDKAKELEDFNYAA